ncbi:MAG: hypothetical protein K8R74_18285 [Bacteroidales bacterium]|nr:hypothetical protein [Bacteroidales bacterium]
MRNEMFNLINRNRIQYYSELKKDRINKTIKIDSLQNEKIIIKKEPQKAGIQSKFLQLFNNNKNSLHTLVFINISKQLSNLASQTKHWILNTHISIANKAAIQSNKLTDGLIRISSQLFEDRYEYTQQTEKPIPVNHIIGYQSINLGLKSTTGTTLSLPYEAVNINLHDQLITWINKIYRNIVLFLESDDWFEEINRSQKTTIKSPVNKKIGSANKIKRIYQTFRIKKRITHQDVKEHPIHDDETTSNQYNGKRFNLFFTNQLKWFSTSIFPAINRFI